MPNVFEYARERPRIVIGCFVVVIVIVAVVIYSNNRTYVTAPQGDIYFDESTQKLTRLPSTQIPPVANSSGSETLVRAVTTDDTMTPESIRYHFRFTPDAKKRLMLAVNANPESKFTLMFLDEMDGKEVRKPQPNSPWISATTNEGKKIINSDQ